MAGGYKVRVTSRDVETLIRVLPEAERQKWRVEWARLQGRSVGADVEWDLALANRLDAYWQALSDRASEVSRNALRPAVDAVGSTALRVALLVAVGIVGVALVRSQFDAQKQ